jgi:hypothetical protein
MYVCCSDELGMVLPKPRKSIPQNAVTPSWKALIINLDCLYMQRLAGCAVHGFVGKKMKAGRRGQRRPLGAEKRPTFLPITLSRNPPPEYYLPLSLWHHCAALGAQIFGGLVFNIEKNRYSFLRAILNFTHGPQG